MACCWLSRAGPADSSRLQERLSIGSLMIHAIRKSLDVRFDDLAMAFPRGRVPLVVEDFFAARRKKIDAFLQAHHTLTPAEMATLLGECNSLDKVKWFMAEEVDDGSPITREALVRLPSL